MTAGSIPKEDMTLPTTLRHLFLDAEGTLWNARPGHTTADFWAHATPETALKIFECEPRLHETLRDLRSQGLRIVLVSRHVKPLLHMLLEAFDLTRYFDQVLVGFDKPSLVAEYLKTQGAEGERGLMVGDTWDADVLPFKRVGHHAVLVNSQDLGAGSIARLASLALTVSGR